MMLMMQVFEDFWLLFKSVYQCIGTFIILYIVFVSYLNFVKILGKTISKFITLDWKIYKTIKLKFMFNNVHKYGT